MTARRAAGLAAVTAALAARVGLELMLRRPPGGGERWNRVNHAGRSVSLLEGPALVVGTSLGAALHACLPAAPGRARRASVAASVAALSAGAFGAYDDLHGDSGSKGLAGHLGALRRGQVTTGAVKVVGLAATGVLAATVADDRSRRTEDVVATLVGAGVVAGSANLANLLDLRPGRALKVGLAAAAAAQPSGAAAAAAGAGLVLIGPDLRGRTMLGDTGANSLGAALGVAAMGGLGLPGRCITLGVLTALTLASERVSFTSVIEATPVLRELDALGR